MSAATRDLPKHLDLDPRSLKLDPSLQPRATKQDRAIEDYTQRYKRGVKMGRVVVFRTPEGDLVADGHHRVPAAIRAGVGKIPCEVHQGTRADALEYALGANLEHRGIRYTNADKRRAVGLALADPELSARSDREIGKLCGVSHVSVGKFRNQVRWSTLPPDEPRTRLGADGKQYRIANRKQNGANDFGDPVPANLWPRTSVDLSDDAIESPPARGPAVPLGNVVPIGEPRESRTLNGEPRWVQPFRRPDGIVIEKYIDPADLPGDAPDDEPCPSQVEGKGDAYEETDPPTLAIPGPPSPLSPGPEASQTDEPEPIVEEVPGEPPDPPEAKLSDEAWLETLPARAGLADFPRRKFDKDALAYRRQKPAMDAYRQAVRRILSQARTNGSAPQFVSWTEVWLRSKDPRHWGVCTECHGTARNKLFGSCGKCRGEGYHL